MGTIQYPKYCMDHKRGQLVSYPRLMRKSSPQDSIRCSALTKQGIRCKKGCTDGDTCTIHSDKNTVYVVEWGQEVVYITDYDPGYTVYTTREEAAKAISKQYRKLTKKDLSSQEILRISKEKEYIRTKSGEEEHWFAIREWKLDPNKLEPPRPI